MGAPTKFAGFGVKFTKPHGAGFLPCSKLARVTRLGFGFDTPAGHAILIEKNTCYFFLVFIEIDQSRRKHESPPRSMEALGLVRSSCGGARTGLQREGNH